MTPQKLSIGALLFASGCIITTMEGNRQSVSPIAQEFEAARLTAVQECFSSAKQMASELEVATTERVCPNMPNPQTYAYSPNGQILALADRDVSLFSADGSCLGTIPADTLLDVPFHDVESLVFSADGSILLVELESPGADQPAPPGIGVGMPRVAVIDVPNARGIAFCELPKSMWNHLHDNRLYALAPGASRSVIHANVFDLARNQATSLLGSLNGRAVFSSNGSQVATGVTPWGLDDDENPNGTGAVIAYDSNWARTTVLEFRAPWQHTLVDGISNDGRTLVVSHWEYEPLHATFEAFLDGKPVSDVQFAPNAKFAGVTPDGAVLGNLLSSMPGVGPAIRAFDPKTHSLKELGLKWTAAN